MTTTAPVVPAKPAPHWLRWVGIGAAAVVLAGLAAFAWDGFQLKQASADLQTHAQGAQDAVTNRDADSLLKEVAALQEASGKFANATSGPQWWVAQWIPWVKDQTRPLQQAGASVHAIADEALGPLAQLDDLSALEVPAIVDGRIDPNVLAPYRETLATAAKSFQDQQAKLGEVSLKHTIRQVREPYRDLTANLATLGSTIQGAHVAAEVLPTMLGGDAPRTYLVMVQNNAEPRTTGGIPGAIIEVKVDDGRITMGRYSTASAMANRDQINFELTKDELNNFSERMLMYPQDVNFTPQYPRSAQLMMQFWKEKYGQDVDGVVSVDPVALGYMLEGMPATQIGGIEVTSDNLAQVMLNESYLKFPDPQQSDAFFALASSTLFGVLTDGSTSSVAGVERAIDEHRFLVFSATPAEQDLLQTTPVAAAFLDRTDTMGLFLNDGSGSKIGYYIDSSLHVTNHMCRDGSLAGQTVTATYTHTFGGDVADLPWYISGGDVYVPAGEFHANVLLYPPSGEGVTSFSVDGQPGMLAPYAHDGRRLTVARIDLLPGQTVTLEYELRASERGILPPDVVLTPGPKPQVNKPGVDIDSEDC